VASTDKDTIWIISFNGLDLYWVDWEDKFLAQAQQKEFTRILKGTHVVPPVAKVLDATKPTDAIDKKFWIVTAMPIKSYYYQSLCWRA